MNFRQLVRTVDTTDCYFEMVSPLFLKAQYNPERFHMWKSLHLGPEEDVLHMMYSPHYRFLRGHEEAYWKLQRMYGRNSKWIKNKIKKFRGVYDSIKKIGFTGTYAMILEKPLVKNEYNKGFEIYEGHHRVSIALNLGLDTIPCEIIRRK